MKFSGTFAAYCFVTALFVFWPTDSLHAHSVGLGLGDFYNGLLHPFLLFTYLLPLAALSIFAGQQAKEKSGKALLVLLLALATGMLASSQVSYHKAYMILHYLLFIITGLLAAASFRLPSAFLYAVVAVCGLVFGYMNGYEANEAGSELLFSSGVLVGFVLFFLWTTAITSTIRKYWMQIALRVVGSWVAAVGILLIGLYF